MERLHITTGRCPAIAAIDGFMNATERTLSG
jgi:hypothetical protein